MPANTAPIFTNVPIIGQGVWTSASTANTSSDGASTIGTSSIKLLTGGTNGTYVNKIRFTPAATAASTATTSSVHRLFISTITSGATTSANTSLIWEISAPSQTADAPSNVVTSLEVPAGFYIPPNYTLLWSMHAAAAANTLWHAVVFAGNY